MGEKANILLIITDHHAFYRHNRPGEYEYVWPCFEEFSSQGVCFSRAYSVHPLCSPARASMMTGMCPSKHGLIWNTEKLSHDNLTDFRQGQPLYSHYLSQGSIRWGKGDRLDWHEGLELLGSGHLKHVADVFNSIEWWKLVPCREWLRVDGSPSHMPTEDDITPSHCAAEVGEIYVIYIPQGNKDKTISVTHLDGKAYKARWYDPRNGVYSDINDGKSVNTDQRDEWTLPSVPDDEDWLLLLEVK